MYLTKPKRFVIFMILLTIALSFKLNVTTLKSDFAYFDIATFFAHSGILFAIWTFEKSKLRSSMILYAALGFGLLFAAKSTMTSQPFYVGELTASLTACACLYLINRIMNR